jgi:hypothetical protein
LELAEAFLLGQIVDMGGPVAIVSTEEVRDGFGRVVGVRHLVRLDAAEAIRRHLADEEVQADTDVAPTVTLADDGTVHVRDACGLVVVAESHGFALVAYADGEARPWAEEWAPTLGAAVERGQRARGADHP